MTPFKRDGPVDLDGSARWRATSSTTARTAASLPVPRREPDAVRDERFELYAAVLDEVGDGATVVAGTGAYDTATRSISPSVRTDRRRRRPDRDARTIEAAQRGIVARFEAVAAATDKPVIVYNIPGRVAINIEPETITRLARSRRPRGQAGVRRSRAARHIVEQPRPLRGRRRPDHAVPRLGGVGGVCVRPHVLGPQVKEMIRLWNAGEPTRRGRSTARSALDRDPARRSEPDRDQGGPEPARPRGRRPPAAAGRRHRGRARARARLSRPAGLLAPARGLAAAGPAGRAYTPAREPEDRPARVSAEFAA